MIQTLRETFLCEICDQHFHNLPLGGIVLEDAVQRPLRICPECGPVDWDVMEFCREAIVGNFEN